MAGGYKVKLPRRFWTPAEDARLAELVAEGMSGREVAERLDRTPKAIFDRAVHLRIKFDPVACDRRRRANLERFKYAPEWAAKRSENSAKICTAERRAAMSAWAKEHSVPRLKAIMQTPEFKAKSAAATRKRHRLKTAWCPEGLRAEYRRLNKTYPARIARQMVEAKMTPFERQLSRVRGGAKVEQRVFKPANDYDYSLIGSQLA